jgi:release factor glutamine methyltransferase
MSTDEPWTIGRLLTWTVDYLQRHGAENPRLDAEVLLAKARGCRRIDLYTSFGDAASDELRAEFRELVRRRAAGTPVAYLVGQREFYSLEFEVTPEVLIPRPETELLVVALLDQMKARDKVRHPLAGSPQESAEAGPQPAPLPTAEGALEIADVGTGSGVLAVCAAKYVPRSRVTAIDISPAALAVARRNAARHGVADRIEFVESDLFANLPAGALYDLIVSNPPYVSAAEMSQLAPDVRDHEPRVALVAGQDGTEVIRTLIDQAAQHLRPGGVLLIEISPMIAGRVEEMLRGHSCFELLATLRDLAGHPRVVQAIRLPSPGESSNDPGGVD